MKHPAIIPFAPVTQRASPPIVTDDMFSLQVLLKVDARSERFMHLHSNALCELHLESVHFPNDDPFFRERVDLA